MATSNISSSEKIVAKATPSQSLISGHSSFLKHMWAGGWLGLSDYIANWMKNLQHPQ